MIGGIQMAMRHLHLRLPEQLHGELRGEAEREGRASADLAREAIEALIRRRSPRVLAEAIATYAARRAGTDGDLDEAVERAGIAHLLEEDEA